jgi:D-beta-D-heptose 7-phosphate kinase/D-beta-D-heptose 1-phosphate adenosyltransferase
MRETLDMSLFANASVLVVGDVMLDYFVYGDIVRISPEAPIPVLNFRQRRSMPGGAGNVAANLAALGVKGSIVGVVGDDADGFVISTLLSEISDLINVDLMTVQGRPTTTKTRFIGKSQQLLRVDREVWHNLTASEEGELIDRVASNLHLCSAVIISDYAKGTLTDRVITEVIKLSSKAGKLILIDPKRKTFDIYKGASFIKPNVAELTLATGIDASSDSGATAAAHRVIEGTGASVLLTRSELGMALFRKDHAPYFARSVARQIFDVSGAGDTACAAFAASLAAGKCPEQATTISNAAASVAVTKIATSAVTATELSMVLSDGQFAEKFDRIVSPEQALAVRNQWKAQGLKVGFTNGCFDILHAGHVSLLDAAAAACDRLIVGLNSDASVRRLKGADRPAQDQATRQQVMASLAVVDLVTVFDEDTPLELISALLPDVLIKGADYSADKVVGADVVKRNGGNLLIVDLVADVSTTRTIERLRRSISASSDKPATQF